MANQTSPPTPPPQHSPDPAKPPVSPPETGNAPGAMKSELKTGSEASVTVTQAAEIRVMGQSLGFFRIPKDVDVNAKWLDFIEKNKNEGDKAKTFPGMFKDFVGVPQDERLQHADTVINLG